MNAWSTATIRARHRIALMIYLNKWLQLTIQSTSSNSFTFLFLVDGPRIGTQHEQEYGVSRFLFARPINNSDGLFLNFFCSLEETEEIQLNEDIINLGVKHGPQDFELKKVLGKGGYGKVFQVERLHIFAPDSDSTNSRSRWKRWLARMQVATSPWKCLRKLPSFATKKTPHTHAPNETS